MQPVALVEVVKVGAALTQAEAVRVAPAAVDLAALVAAVRVDLAAPAAVKVDLAAQAAVAKVDLAQVEVALQKNKLGKAP